MTDHIGRLTDALDNSLLSAGTIADLGDRTDPGTDHARRVASDSVSYAADLLNTSCALRRRIIDRPAYEGPMPGETQESHVARYRRAEDALRRVDAMTRRLLLRSLDLVLTPTPQEG